MRGLTIRNRIAAYRRCVSTPARMVLWMTGIWCIWARGQWVVGGAGLVMMEATGVAPEGRITPACTGIWKDAHIEALQRIL